MNECIKVCELPLNTIQYNTIQCNTITSPTLQIRLELLLLLGIVSDDLLQFTQPFLQLQQFLDIQDQIQHQRSPPTQHGRLQEGLCGFGEQFQLGQNEQVVEQPVTEEPDPHSQS